MRKVENGNFVKVHYTGTLDTGEIFDTSGEGSPLEVCIGAGDLIPGFELALMGMSPTEKKTFTVEPSEGYGDRDESLEQTFPRADFPEGFPLEEGQILVLQGPDDGQFPATIRTLSEENVMLDLNHPLAGKTLTFQVEIMEINDHATEPESGCNCGCSSCS